MTYARRLQRSVRRLNDAPLTIYQDFTPATWGSNASSQLSTDGLWRRNGDWVGTGGHSLQLTNELVDLSAGTLSLICRANSTNAGEVQSVQAFMHGYFEARLKIGKVAGTCQSFFLISAPDYGPGEIDFEFLTGGDGGWWLNGPTGAVMVNVHPIDVAVEVKLPFNPCNSFHTYGVLWTTTHIGFYVDGVLMHDWTNVPTELGIGARPLYVMANNWTSQSSNWGGGPPATDAIAMYDYFKVWQGATRLPAGATGS